MKLEYLMVGCFEKNRKIIRGKAFEPKKKKPALKFIPRLGLSQSSNNYTLVSTFFSLFRIHSKTL